MATEASPKQRTESGKFFEYSKKPLSYENFNKMRGNIDFSNAKQFNFYESGYSFLIVINRPKFIEELGNKDSDIMDLLNLFCYVLENEFRGLSGIEDLTTEALTYDDGINQLETLGKSVQQSKAEITMSFTERSGLALTRFVEYYIKGCKATRTQAKTYHGLIKEGSLAPGFENEVFNFLYIVTDNTTYGLEKAFMLLNAWPNKAPFSILESEKGTIETKTIELTFTCFILDGDIVNKKAIEVLSYVHESGSVSEYYNKYGLFRDTADKYAVGLKDGGHSSNPIEPNSDRIGKYTIFNNFDESNKDSEFIKNQKKIYTESNTDTTTI